MAGAVAAVGCSVDSSSGFLKLRALVDEATVFMCGTKPASSNSWPATWKGTNDHGVNQRLSTEQVSRRKKVELATQVLICLTRLPMSLLM